MFHLLLQTLGTHAKEKWWVPETAKWSMSSMILVMRVTGNSSSNTLQLCMTFKIVEDERGSMYEHQERWMHGNIIYRLLGWNIRIDCSEKRVAKFSSDVYHYPWVVWYILEVVAAEGQRCLMSSPMVKGYVLFSRAGLWVIFSVDSNGTDTFLINNCVGSRVLRSNGGGMTYGFQLGTGQIGFIGFMALKVVIFDNRHNILSV